MIGQEERDSRNKGGRHGTSWISTFWTSSSICLTKFSLFIIDAVLLTKVPPIQLPSLLLLLGLELLCQQPHRQLYTQWCSHLWRHLIESIHPSIFCLSGFLSRGKRHPNLPLTEPFPDQPNQYLGAASQGNPRTVVVLGE